MLASPMISTLYLRSYIASGQTGKHSKNLLTLANVDTIKDDLN